MACTNSVAMCKTTYFRLTYFPVYAHNSEAATKQLQHSCHAAQPDANKPLPGLQPDQPISITAAVKPAAALPQPGKSSVPQKGTEVVMLPSPVVSEYAPSWYALQNTNNNN